VDLVAFYVANSFGRVGVGWENVPGTYEGEPMTGPHEKAPGENPEDHVGDEIPDPWDDETQTDWGGGVDGELGTDSVSS